MLTITTASRASNTIRVITHTGLGKVRYAAMFPLGTKTATNALKGTIRTIPTWDHRFRDCEHIELYGHINLPLVAKRRNGDPVKLTLGLSYEPPPGSNSTVLRPRALIREDECIVQLHTLNGSGKSYSCSLMYSSVHPIDGSDDVWLWTSQAGRNAPLDDLDKVEQQMLSYLRWCHENNRGTILKTRLSTGGETWSIIKRNMLNKDLAALKSTQESMWQHCPGFLAMKQHQDEVMADALNSLQDLPTLSIAAQIGLDGLITQALSQVGLSISELIRGRGIEKLKSLAQVDLASKYGVLAPLADYKDLFETCMRYYSEGVRPFYEKSAVGSRTYSYGPWTSRITCGIAWNWTKSNVWMDSFALIHQGGLDLMPSQVWDLIPFSFAIDWLVNISSLLERLDAEINSQRYPVDYAWRTFRAERNVLLFGQEVRCVAYKRERLRRLPDLLTDFEWRSVRGTLSTSSLTEAVALAVSLLLK